jgi:hypothetical protein
MTFFEFFYNCKLLLPSGQLCINNLCFSGEDQKKLKASFKIGSWKRLKGGLMQKKINALPHNAKMLGSQKEALSSSISHFENWEP